MTRMMSQYLRACVLLVSAMTLSGCYTTQAQIKHSALKSTGEVKNAGILVHAIKDERPDAQPKIIGGVYNGYDMRMGDVNQPDTLLEDLRLALVDQFRASGYRIQSDESDLVVDASIRMLSCDVRSSSKSALSINVRLSDHGKVVFEDTYAMNESKFWLIAADPTCSEPLNTLVRKSFEKIVKDIDQYLAS